MESGSIVEEKQLSIQSRIEESLLAQLAGQFLLKQLLLVSSSSYFLEETGLPLYRIRN